MRPLIAGEAVMCMKTGVFFTGGRGAVAALAVAALVHGEGARSQTISNASFEADTFATAPGYVSVNAPITGWTANRADLVGLNPAGGQSLFANNGAVPNGTRVAFLRGTTGAVPPAVLGTTLTGLTPGQTYKVNFRCNARSNTVAVTNANLRAAIDGETVLSLTNLTSVTGGNPYRYIAFDFTAAAESQTLTMTNNRPHECALLVDDFSIGVNTGGWSIAVWTNDATSGVDPAYTYTHAYNFDSTAAGATINGITFRGLAGANPVAPVEMYSSGLPAVQTAADANSVTTNGGGGAALATRFIYGGNPESITIGGLVPGAEYVATFYSVGWDTPEYGRSATFIAGTDRLTVNQGTFGNNQGILIACRYTAPSNGVMTLACTPLRDATIHVYGFSNREALPPGLPAVGPVQPAAHVASPGFSATFRVAASGAEPLTYQWMKDGVPIDGEVVSTLLVPVTDASSTGAYSVIVYSGASAVTSSASALSFGPIANPGFEADSFFTPPGYINSNVAISGWTASNPGRIGVNPLIDGQSVLANNGAVPEGRQVGFIQSNGSTNHLSTTLTGLTPGESYTVSWRYNARTITTKPTLRAAIDEAGRLDALVSNVGTTNPYRYAAFDFTASASTHTLSLTNDGVGDSTVLLDDFRVGVSSGRWSVAPWSDDASSGVDPSRHTPTRSSSVRPTTRRSPACRSRGWPAATPRCPARSWRPGFRTSISTTPMCRSRRAAGARCSGGTSSWAARWRI